MCVWVCVYVCMHKGILSVLCVNVHLCVIFFIEVEQLDYDILIARQGMTTTVIIGLL